MKSIKNIIAMLFIAIYGVAGLYSITCLFAIIGKTFTSDFITPFLVALSFVVITSPIAMKVGKYIDNM